MRGLSWAQLTVFWAVLALFMRKLQQFSCTELLFLIPCSFAASSNTAPLPPIPIYMWHFSHLVVLHKCLYFVFSVSFYLSSKQSRL